MVASIGYEGDVVFINLKDFAASKLLLLCSNAVGLMPPAVLCRDCIVKSAYLTALCGKLSEKG